jgi:flagellar motor switch protein FliN/FliY
MPVEDSIGGYFEHWIEEFARAVEMFTGERPVVAEKAADKGQVDECEATRADYHWWQQETEPPQKFAAWIGAKEACFSALGGSDGGDPKELFQEMLSQANQGAVAVLSSSFPTPLRFGNGSVNPPPGLASLRLILVGITFKDAELPPLVIALEPAAGKILDGPEAENTGGGGLPPQAAPALSAKASSMLDRLMDLQLPVSVLLGQTVMPIREALKITSGSLVELDRQLGDYVEVMIHGTVVARGEIVAIRGYYGVRIKEVISRKDRIALKDAA